MANFDQAACINALDARGFGLRVEFFHTDDRYAHRVIAVGGNCGETALLESIEDDDQDCPNRPALQALNLDQLREQGEPAALIGMSGSCHWSLSVEKRTKEGTIGILFDAACRIRTETSRLASMYRISTEVQDSQDLPSRLYLRTTLGPITFQGLSVDGASDPPPLLQLDGDRLSVIRESKPGLSKTLRWRYAINVELAL
jgi:hypothetical protein